MSRSQIGIIAILILVSLIGTLALIGRNNTSVKPNDSYQPPMLSKGYVIAYAGDVPIIWHLHLNLICMNNMKGMCWEKNMAPQNLQDLAKKYEMAQ